MSRKRITARSAASARRKASGKGTVVTKVNYIQGSSRKGVRTYSVTTKKRQRKGVHKRHHKRKR